MKTKTLNSLQPQAQRDKDLLREFKRTVLQVVPDAQVILYGSRARGEASPESDYDLLIVIPEPLAPEEKERLNDLLYEVELEHNAVLSTLIYDLASWEDATLRATPLRQNIEREGVSL